MLSNWTEFIRLNRNESCKPTDLKKGKLHAMTCIILLCREIRYKRKLDILSLWYFSTNQKRLYLIKKMIIIEKKNIFWIPYTSIEIHIDASFLFMIIIIIFFVICFDDECSYQAISSLFTALYTYFSTY